MKKIYILILLGLIFLGLGIYKIGEPKEDKKESPFYEKSLHYYARGMAYWYNKENGGIEQLTGIPYDKLICSDCHAKTCDTCHKIEKNGELKYSIEAAKNIETCLKCHKRQKIILELIKTQKEPDVHFSKGMKCMDCHTAREMHGDGKEYNYSREKEAMDTKCEKCHPQVPDIVSHKIHKDKLHCSACHVRQVVTCANCHMDTLIKEGKRFSIPLHGWVFLINYEGKIVSGNIQTFVVNKNQTFVIFAPYYSHDVVKKGKICEDCHASEHINKIKEGSLVLTYIKEGKLENIKGVIPIVEGVEYINAYMDYKDGKWIPLENPQKPLIQFVASGKPLTKDQFQRLSIPFTMKNQ